MLLVGWQQFRSKWMNATTAQQGMHAHAPRTAYVQKGMKTKRSRFFCSAFTHTYLVAFVLIGAHVIVECLFNQASYATGARVADSPNYSRPQWTAIGKHTVPSATKNDDYDVRAENDSKDHLKT